ncbi:RNA polymerase sigma factor [Ekhidna sp.]
MDEVYLDKILAGDSDAYRYFINTYKDMALNIAVSIVKDDQYAEEVAQDAFVKAFSGIKSFNRESKFSTWFYRIVVNESFQRLRKLKKEVPTTDINEVSFKKTSANESDEDRERIEKALKALPANESLALNLFYLEENSLKEVMNITGWTLANTKVILHRARKNLRSKMEKTK